MPRRGRSASPPPATRRAAAPPPSRNVPAHAPPAAPAPAPASAMGQPQQPSMFAQMAATAGGVAVGSAVIEEISCGCGRTSKRDSSPRSRYSRAEQSAPARPPPVSVQPVPRRGGSMFRDAAAIAGGVTVGTTVGHLAGEAISSLFTGPRRHEVQESLPQNYNPNQEPNGPCAYEISQFLQCAANISSNQDLQVCDPANKELQACKRRNRIP